MKTENYVKELFFIIFRQKRVIGWTIIITLVLALLITLFWPPIYSATGNILVRGMKTEKSPQAIEKEMVRSPVVGRETLASEERILISSTVIEQTLNKMMSENLIPTVTGQDLVAEVYRIQSNLKTELVPASNVIEISYFDNDRDLALTLLSYLMENYIQYRNRIYNPADDREYFAENAERYRQMLAAKEDELLELVHRNNVSDPASEMASNYQVKQNLQLRLQQLQNESISYFGMIKHLDELLSVSMNKQKDLQINDLKKGDSGSAPPDSSETSPERIQTDSTILNDSQESLSFVDPVSRRAMPLFSFIESVPAIIELNRQVQELLMERGLAMRAYNVESVKVKLLARHLEEAYERLHAEVRNYRDKEKTMLHGILRKIENLEQQITEIDRMNVMLQEQIISQRKIERDIAVFLSSFEVFSMRREESMAGLDDQLPSQVSIVKRAFPSNGPVFPKPFLMLALGLLLGILLGMTLGFLREYFDHTFKKPSEVERYTGMQVIVSIPFR